MFLTGNTLRGIILLVAILLLLPPIQMLIKSLSGLYYSTSFLIGFSFPVGVPNTTKVGFRARAIFARQAVCARLLPWFQSPDPECGLVKLKLNAILPAKDGQVVLLGECNSRRDVEGGEVTIFRLDWLL